MEKEWKDRFLYTNYFDVDDDTYTAHWVRDWTFGKGTELSQNWLHEIIVKKSELSRCWFTLEAFPYWDGIGHAYISFEWPDHTVLSFSIEARLTKDQLYSPIDGLFNVYELGYTWGTERDFLTRRLVHLGNKVYNYPLAITQHDAQSLFEITVAETNALYKKPRKYNSLTANCVNLLVDIMSRHFKGRLPYDPAMHIPGFFDFYLMRKGFIDVVEQNYLKTRGKYALGPLREAIAGFAAHGTHQEFSTSLRALLKETEVS